MNFYTISLDWGENYKPKQFKQFKENEKIYFCATELKT